jgi:Outer membrane receptor proteins, mostly Fe transport
MKYKIDPFRGAVCILSTLSAPFALANIAQAQEGAAASSGNNNEIIVTAQKRDETLHDVPVTVSVLTENLIREQNIASLADAARLLPNVKIDTISFGIAPQMRGFSTDPLYAGYEQAVGLVIDGVPYTRGAYFGGALFDIGQLEALYGPQGQLFGKNSTVGTLNLRTASPTDHFTANAEVSIGDYGRRRFSGALSGPLIPGFLNFRVSGIHDENDGYIKNTTTVARTCPDQVGQPMRPAINCTPNKRFQQFENNGFRAKLQFTDIAGGTVDLTYERTDSWSSGPGYELYITPQRYQDAFRAFDPNADFQGGNWVASEDFPTSQTAETEIFSVNANFDLGGWGIALRGGHANLQSVRFSGDEVPLIFTDARLTEKSHQTTAEFQVSSPELDGFLGLGGLGASSDFVAGFFYQNVKLDPTTTTSELEQTTAFTFATTLDADPTTNGTVIGNVLAGLPPSIEYQNTPTIQNSNVYAFFGQLNWHLTDELTFLYGMRYTHEKKTADSTIFVIGPCGTSDCAPFLKAAIILPAYPSSFTGVISEDNFSPKLGLKYEANPDLNFFLTWAKSYRGSGFNTALPGVGGSPFAFEPEDAESWELGAKGRFLDGKLNLNVGLYWTTLSNFQVNTTQVVPGTSISTSYVVNAGKLRSRGFEADLNYVPNDWLTIRGALAYTDTKFLDFTIGGCVKDRPNTDGDADPRCDLTGKPLPRAPKWSFSLTPSVDIPLSTDVSFIGNANFTFQSSQYLDDSLDDRTKIGSFMTVDLSAGLRFDTANAGAFDLGVSVRNLTNVAVPLDRRPAMLAALCVGCFTESLAPPRTVLGYLRWNY